MRPIKFRAWNKRLNCWDYSVLEFNADGQVIIYEYCDYVQFTGLHDSSGKEIYEGDICDFWIEGDLYMGVVNYEDSACSYYFDVDDETSFQMVEANTAEIIGNKYENPELLKETL
jgi:uncharacterized phage protein (TIGR01671 family)